MQTQAPERMQCMEVWGGNRAVDRTLTTTGLDVSVYSSPHANSQSGGDVCYVSSCASGRITRILLADVSGHGDAVADRAVILRQLMRRNINRIDQSSLVNSINQEFVVASTQGHFATALIGTFFSPTGMLTLSNAGHPHPLIYQHKTGRWRELKAEEPEPTEACNFPLGIEADESYSDLRTRLNPGDLVLAFTDGLIEIEQPNGQLLGADGLLQVVSRLEHSDPNRFIESLIQEIAPRKDALNTGDDVSIILFQTNTERVSLRDNLLSPFRVVAGLFHQGSA
ncbi:Phosphoserine phosphatase RsbU [Symmachiella dynata]|uniref:PP2C family protein-serine/threonine phosphatase n=1 Tax=Symmachiella dynata TaxID=2527995 RepID=UPI00118B9A3F|nr:PP2C family protein-serine/threonine phosphatase [Symmachiella dynata]QDT49078.1 Phosphoserine phosphatase RsbU [Symmachiella dynata]